MNFRHQSRQQDLEEKRLLMEQVTMGLISKEDAQKHMRELDEAARELACIAAGEQPHSRFKSVGSRAVSPDSTSNSSKSDDEDNTIDWPPTP